MDSQIASNERADFCQRLRSSLVVAGHKPSPTILSRSFNSRADGAAVTVHGARKWLKGESIPTQERLHILARWLEVPAQWLRYGESDPPTVADGRHIRNFAPRELGLLSNYRLLDVRSQEIILELVEAMITLRSKPR